MERFIFSLMVAFFAIIFLAIGAKMSASAECLAAGYPRAKINYTLTRYCIKRVDQTDVVVPLADL